MSFLERSFPVVSPLGDVVTSETSVLAFDLTLEVGDNGGGRRLGEVTGRGDKLPQPSSGDLGGPDGPSAAEVILNKPNRVFKANSRSVKAQSNLHRIA